MPGRENMTLEGVQSSRFLSWQRCLRTTNQPGEERKQFGTKYDIPTWLRAKRRGTKSGERGKSLPAK